MSLNDRFINGFFSSEEIFCLLLMVRKYVQAKLNFQDGILILFEQIQQINVSSLFFRWLSTTVAEHHGRYSLFF